MKVRTQYYLYNRPYVVVLFWERLFDGWLCTIIEHVATSRFWRLFHLLNMDLLHTQLNNIQRHLAFVAVDPINWKFYVQSFSWAVTIFESYLL